MFIDTMLRQYKIWYDPSPHPHLALTHIKTTHCDLPMTHNATAGETKAPTTAKTARMYCGLDIPTGYRYGKIFDRQEVGIGFEVSSGGDLDDYNDESFEIKGLELVITNKTVESSFTKKFKTTSEVQADHDGKVVTVAASLLKDKVCGVHQSQATSLTFSLILLIEAIQARPRGQHAGATRRRKRRHNLIHVCV